MKIKKYLAHDMKEACRLIKQDLGNDAIIVDSKKVRKKGIMGFIQPRMLEVTAAVDQKEHNIVYKETQKDAEDSVRKELNEMKELLKQVIIDEKKHSKNLKNPKSAKKSAPRKYNAAIYFNKFLKDLDLLPEVEKMLKDKIAKEKLDSCTNEAQFKELFASEIMDFFVPFQKGKSNILAFIGPTGVGKTTTVAKLAANFALYHELNVALLTIDTYRIGAVAQLKTYGEIIGVNVEAVMSPLELKSSVLKNKDCDLILIDTAGRSSKNTEQIEELKKFLDAIKPVETYLVLDINTKNRDLLKIIENYSVLDLSKLVLTKIDETYSLGTILNVVIASKLPIAYVTNGQSVPDDIIPGDPEKLAKLIMGEVE